MLANNLLTPAQCNPKITESTPVDEWYSVLKGGYNVHLVPEPPSTKIEPTTKINAGINNQNLKALIRGKDISDLPINNGSIQFPNPPINAGITIKKNYN